jgi:septal ring factor EnvC (AmiA/AmiB activator)
MVYRYSGGAKGSRDGSGATEELEKRREEIGRKIAAKQAERDRYVRLYAQEHISESELEMYLADLKNQTDNLKLLLGSVEADLSQEREHQELSATTHAWLVTLRERVEKIEEDTPEAYQKRRQLVRLLVAGITVGRGPESVEVQITYRFGPPDGSEEQGQFMDGLQNTERGCCWRTCRSGRQGLCPLPGSRRPRPRRTTGRPRALR